MNIQEMSTIKQYRLPVKIFILNNHYMGMVRQWQELLHGNDLSNLIWIHYLILLNLLNHLVQLAESHKAWRGRRLN